MNVHSLVRAFFFTVAAFLALFLVETVYEAGVGLSPIGVLRHLVVGWRILPQFLLADYVLNLAICLVLDRSRKNQSS